MTTENKQRIAKFIAAAGVCSRRDAERLIAEGRVMLNGVMLDTPATLVDENDVVVVDGKTISNSTQTVRLWRYHKPAGLVTTHHDPEGRATVFEHLPKHLPRVISIGRLDLDSEGLLLLTTSGSLSRALELPKNAAARTYRVRVRSMPAQTHLDQLERGVRIDDVQYKPIEAHVDFGQSQGRNCWLTLTLREGKNREIRRIFEHFDLPVSRLIRMQYGEFELGDLAPGAVDEIPAWQIAELMNKLGLS